MTRITTQSRKCNFGQLEKRMLKDKIVSGIKNDKVREKLLAMSELTYEKEVDVCRASEIAQRQATMSKNSDTRLAVSAIKKKI